MQEWQPVHCRYGTASVVGYGLDAAVGSSTVVSVTWRDTGCTPVVMAGEGCHASLYSFNFGDVAFDGVPH